MTMQLCASRNALLDAALEYARRGWLVFPCEPGDKRPLARLAPHGMKDATKDVKTIQAWWAAVPSANVAIACGVGDCGPYVIDVDAPHGGHKSDGAESLAVAGIKLPATLAARTPNGGMHRYYGIATPPDRERLRNATNANNLMGVDYRVGGGYVLAPPSVVNGKCYEWLEPRPSHLAPWPSSMYLRKAEAIGATEENAAHTNIETCRKRDGFDALARARMYLASCDAAISGQGGHASTIHAAHAMVVGFNLSDEDALRLLMEDYNSRCVPPWSEKELRHKVESARKNPQKPFGYLLDNEAPMMAKEDEVTLDGLADFIDRNSAGGGDGVDDGESTGDVAPSPCPVPGPSLSDAGNELVRAAPGLVGEIARWTLSTSRRPQPLFALATGISVCAAIMGRKVKTSTGARTNIYGVILGKPGCGKDWPQKAALRILEDSELLGSEPTSEGGLEKMLATTPSKLLVLDEIGHFISSAKTDAKTGGAAGGLQKMLLKLYSSADVTYLGREYAERGLEARKIDQPCLNILGATTPTMMLRNLKTDDIENGFLPRLLVFPSVPSKAKDDDPDEPEVPAYIASAAAAWRDFIPKQESKDIAGALKWQPLSVPVTQAAKETLAALGRDAESKAEGGGCALVWGRAREMATRLALVCACSRIDFGQWREPSVEEPDAAWSARLVRLLVGNLHQIAESNAASSFDEWLKKRMLSVIRDAGSKGIGHNELTRKTQFIKNARTRTEYLQDLANGGFVRIETRGTKGRPKLKYYAR